MKPLSKDFIARMKRMSKSLRVKCYCPCCNTIKKCLKDCTFDVDCPKEYEKMAEAREIYWGKEKYKKEVGK